MGKNGFFKKYQYGTGGILVEDNYAVVGISDIAFTLSNGTIPFVTEIKTERSWPQNSHWYHGTRCYQSLSAAFFLNCPALLTSQQQFKLILPSANGICIFPSSDPFSTTYGTSSYFLDCIVLCLLSTKYIDEKRPEMITFTPKPTKIYNLKNTIQKASKSFSSSSTSDNNTTPAKSNNLLPHSFITRNLFYLTEEEIEKCFNKDFESVHTGNIETIMESSIDKV